ncbi:MAG: methylated-DNA--[protein]-cysteine S-methyltransferase [Bacteroidota bacterium]
MSNTKAERAVARTNGENRISIILPCHHIIGSDSSIAGYGGGIHRKQWLLKHASEHQ